MSDMNNGFGNESGRAVPPPMPGQNNAPKSKRRGCLVMAPFVVGGLFVCGFIVIALLLVIFAATTAPSFSSSSSASGIRESFESGDMYSSNKIAVIDVTGIISSFESSWSDSSIAHSGTISAQIKVAASDDNVRAVVVRLNTPGGEVTASDVIHHELLKLRETGKPVVACMEAVAASGGLYVAVASNYIFANRHSTTGSIGVIAQIYNYSGLFSKVGLQAETYSSGPMKDFLNGSRERNAEEILLINELLDEIYTDFVRIVAEGRPSLEVDDIRNTIMGDGRILTGSQALEWGLIDELGYFDDAVAKAAELADVEDYKVVSYSRQMGILDILGHLESGDKKIAIEVPGLPSPGDGARASGKFFFLPAF